MNKKGAVYLYQAPYDCDLNGSKGFAGTTSTLCGAIGPDDLAGKGEVSRAHG